ncbi:MAG: hypothetical protein H7061_12415 [Bdellovibrionaceae bacterium]|nr:hypothetical protein [Bdellovibrio sp.]
MKKTVYGFSKIAADLSVKDHPQFNEKFDFIANEDLTAAATLARNFDFILLGDGDYEQFRPLIKAIGWKINHLSVADLIVREANHYRPMNLEADCILHAIQTHMVTMSTSTTVLVIGYFDFVLSVAAKLALAGFSKFIISLANDSQFTIIKKRLAEFIFNLDIKYVSLNELTQIQQTSSLLISNLSEKVNQEAYESLTYFNFLSAGGVFVDAHSQSNTSLIEEARRAELNVIEESEILTLKFKTMVDLSKNPS